MRPWTSRGASAAISALLACASLSAQAQAWKPAQPVEIIIACAPGCGPDNMARLMQRVFQVNRYLDSPMIQNKAGGGGTVARTYLRQFEGNGHYLYSSDKGLLAAHAMGRAVYTDLTPVAVLFGEYIAVAVKADSPIKSGRDLIERLRKDPAAHSFGIATSIGNINHQSVAGPMKSAGVDVRRMRNVVFQSGALAITALLGGHIDAVPVSVGLWASHMKVGAVRVIAVSSGERLPEPFSAIPTWREQGADSVTFNWRAMFGARGMQPAHVAWWENTFQRFIDTPDWKSEMEARSSVTRFMGAARMKDYLDEEYPETRAFLVELELVKK